MKVSLMVEAVNGVMNSAFEIVGVGEGAVGELMLLEVAPAAFDVVQLGRVFRQPLGGDPSTLGQRLRRQLAGMDRPLSSTATKGRVRSAAP